MKYILTALLVSLTLIGFAQSPMLVNYQGIARDAMGNPIAGQAIALKFEILQGSVTGSVIYTENQTSVLTSTLGMFSTQIGKSANLGQVSWQNGPYFLQVSMDPTGGANLVVLGTQQIVSVPFAMHAESVPSTYTNNILTIGSQTHAISSGTAVTVTQGTGTNVTVSGGPNYTISYAPPQLTLSSGSIGIVGSNSVALPVSITPTIIPSGIATVTNGASTYTVGVPAPSYNQSSGILSMGSSTTFVAPTLNMAGSVLYSGPFSNSVAIPSAVTVAGTGLATVSGGPNYLVNVLPPVLALSSNNLSLSIVGSNSIAFPTGVTVAGAGSLVSVTGGPTNYTVSIPNPAFTGTALTLGTSTTVIAPTLAFNPGTGILTSGAASNSISLNSFGPFTQAGTSVSLTTISNSVAIGLNSASAKLEVYSNVTSGSIIKATSPNASNTSPAVDISSANGTGLVVTNTGIGGIAGDFSATNGYALSAQNSNSLNPTIYANNTHASGTSGYFKGTLITESKLGGLAFNSRNSSSADIFVVRDDGSVGVGYTSPVAKLDVNGNLRIGDNSSGTGQLYFGGVGGVNSGYTGIYNNSAGDLTFAVFKSGGTATPFGGANSMDAFIVKSQTGNIGIGTSAPVTKLDVAGAVKITDGSQGSGKILVSDAVGTASWTSSPAAISFGGLNNGSVLVSSSTTTLGTPSMVFTKQYAATEVEVSIYSSASGGSFSGGATMVSFEIYIDGNPGTVTTQHYFFVPNTTNYISLKSYFSGLPVGSHTVNIVSRTDAGTTNVVLDPSGFGGKVILKEVF